MKLKQRRIATKGSSANRYKRKVQLMGPEKGEGGPGGGLPNKVLYGSTL